VRVAVWAPAEGTGAVEMTAAGVAGSGAAVMGVVRSEGTGTARRGGTVGTGGLGASGEGAPAAAGGQ